MSSKHRRHETEFMRMFRSLTYRRAAQEVWNDLIQMFACAISNAADVSHFSERENRYLRIIRKYSKREQDIFPKLLAQMVLELEQNPEQDFLGDVYMKMDFGNREKGQIFTPYSVSAMMAEIIIGDVEKQLEKQGYITICDPCCGAGGMLIAAVNSVKKKLRSTKWNAQDCMLMIGQDIDEIAALMCYIQLSLFGMAGYVKVGNTLTEPISEHDTMDQYWFTPMYFSDVWVIHRQKERTEQYLKGDVENEM